MSLLERYCLHCGAATQENDVACAACGTSLKITRPLDQKSLLPPPDLRLAVHLQTLQLFNERYRIVRQVGVGGFGAVYEAADTWEPKRVAIKEISLAGLSAQQVIEATGSFNREVQMLSRLQHAGIPKMYEQSTDAEHWYLVMEFIAGKTLEEALDQSSGRRLPLEQVLRIGVQICTVLEYLHTQRPAVIFRDLKPANVMLTPEGHLYLIDFGVARRYQPGRARDTVAFGSPGFAAPEQYGRAQTTPLSDIYSLGALLHCMLSGDDPSEHPFHFAPLRASGVEGLRELDTLIQRMVSPDSARRPQRVRAELQRIQHLRFQSTTRAPLWIPPRGQTPPHLAAISKSGAQKSLPAPQTAPSPVTTVTTSGGQQQQQVMLVATAPGTQAPGTSLQPKQRKTTRRRLLAGGLLAGVGLFAFEAINLLHSHQNNVATMNALPTVSNATPVGADETPAVQSEGPTPVSQSSGPVLPYVASYVSWSADLSSVAATYSSGLEIDIYSVKKQYGVLSSTISVNDPYGGSAGGSAVLWYPDNSRLCVYNSSYNSFVWDIGQKKQMYNLPQISNSAAWSPDGQYLAGAGIDPANAPSATGIMLFLLGAADGKQIFRATFDDPKALGYLAWSPDSRYLVLSPSSGNNLVAGQKWALEIWDVQVGQRASVIGGQLPGSGSSAYVLSGLAWAPDGKTIAVALNNDIWLISLAYGAGSPTQGGTRVFKAAVVNSGSFAAHVLTWSPNSKYLAIAQHEDNGSLEVWAVASGKSVLRVDPVNNVQVAAGLSWSSDSKYITTADGRNVLSTWKIG